MLDGPGASTSTSWNPKMHFSELVESRPDRVCYGPKQGHIGMLQPYHAESSVVLDIP